MGELSKPPLLEPRPMSALDFNASLLHPHVPLRPHRRCPKTDTGTATVAKCAGKQTTSNQERRILDETLQPLLRIFVGDSPIPIASVVPLHSTVSELATLYLWEAIIDGFSIIYVTGCFGSLKHGLQTF